MEKAIFKLYDFDSISRWLILLFFHFPLCSLIYMNLVISMRWGEQGAMVVVSLTQKSSTAMLHNLTPRRTWHQVSLPLRNQQVHQVPMACTLVEHWVPWMLHKKRMDPWCRRCVNSTTMPMAVATASTNQVSQCRPSIPSQVKGERKGTVWGSSGVACWWARPRTELSPSNELFIRSRMVYPAPL